jgi:hypothetical protein
MSYRTIKIKKYLDIIEEFIAAETIYPGSLIELTTDKTVRKHATATGNALPMFALEDELQGKGIDDAYTAGQLVQCWTPTRGDVVLAILADGGNVGEGDFLESNGYGYLQAHVADTASQDAVRYSNPIVGLSLEEMDASGDSSGQDMPAGLGANKRIKVKIL